MIYIIFTNKLFHYLKEKVIIMGHKTKCIE